MKKPFCFILEFLIPILTTSLEDTQFEDEAGLSQGLSMTFPEPELDAGSGKSTYVGFTLKEGLT